MPIDNHGFVWDPEGWKNNTLTRRRAAEAKRKEPIMTERQHAQYAWHLKLNMQARFGNRTWMDGVVDPNILEWGENGDRLRKPGARLLADDHTIIPAPKPKRRLRHL